MTAPFRRPTRGGCRRETRAALVPEFADQAGNLAAQILRLLSRDRILASRRGSGDPAALAWPAEKPQLSPAVSVVDLDARLGSPTESVRKRYGCTGAPTTALASDNLRVGLTAGVVSVIENDPEAAPGEVRTNASVLGLTDHRSTPTRAVVSGGSTFHSSSDLNPNEAGVSRAIDDGRIALVV